MADTLKYYFYILRCGDNSLYCGMARDVKSREKTHNTGKGSAYVRSRGGGIVVHTEEYDSIGDALRREREVKKWSKDKKEALVAKRSTLS